MNQIRCISAALAISASILMCGVAQAAPTVTLERTIPVHAQPNGKVVEAVNRVRPITGEPTVLPVIAKRPGWDQVLLPQRPDGSRGWISTQGTRAGSTPWSISINLGQRKAHIYLRHRLLRSYSVVVGRPSLPTPTGTFFVAEVVYEGDSDTGPYALATSAYSNELQEFDGGPGQVALHGRIDLPEPLGTASSHGCVRFEDQAITWLAAHVPPGSLIHIVS